MAELSEAADERIKIIGVLKEIPLALSDLFDEHGTHADIDSRLEADISSSAAIRCGGRPRPGDDVAGIRQWDSIGLLAALRFQDAAHSTKKTFGL